MKLKVFIISLFTLSFVTLNAQSDLLAYNDNVEDFVLIDNSVEEVETTLEEESTLYKTGVMLMPDKTTASIDLTYVSKDENVGYRFDIKNLDGELARTYRFIQLKKSDKKIVLDFNGLDAGRYVVEVSQDIPFGNMNIVDNNE